MASVEGGAASRWAWRAARIAVLTCCALAGWSARAEAQLGSLLSPGKLSRHHAALDGIGSCVKCHEQGRKVTAAKCLACHKPIADRIERKTGVHKSVKNDCVACHAEHAGVDGELRPFDQARFNHAAVTGFALDGKHAPLTANCAACHKTRSFVTLTPACASCHNDVHKGTLGKNCASCHSPRTAFTELSGGFDHGRARFALTGAHQKVVCEKCHVNRVFRGLKFSACSDCHKDPHKQTFGPSCTTCHATDSFRTRKVDHTKTNFQLVGKHTTVACALCHKQPAMQVKPKADTCAACHVDVHKGTFKQDCKSCHSESGFGKGQFDHRQTQFPLADKHATVACTVCHAGVVVDGLPLAKKSADFRGLKTACASCHADVHRAELGTACESCHSSKTFKVAAFTHPTNAEFYAGQHAPAACDKCHKEMAGRPIASTLLKPAPGGAARAAAPLGGFKATPTTCASCHRDVHLGQVGRECQTCHSIKLAKFGVASFSHGKTAFPLTGRHTTVECAKCHKPETATFPAGQGTAVRFKGVAKECRGCHQDIHLGQLTAGCDTCHNPEGFKFKTYTHTNRALAKTFFVGRHLKAACAACHKPVTGEFPKGIGTAVRFKLSSACVACHEDIHRGSLGQNCIECHRP